MAETSITTTPNPAPPPPPPAKKSLWETTITSTPVIMTVIATLFAGMSASEMTWAQFHRATAAQDQSKVGDGYNFFQAKRIRGTSMEMTSTLLRALSEPGQFDAAALEQSANFLADEMSQAEKNLQRLAQDARTANATAGAGEAKGNPALGRLQQSAESALAKVKGLKDEASQLRKDTDKAMTGNKDEMNKAFGYLNGGLPLATEIKMSDKENLAGYADDVNQLTKAIEDRKPDTDPEVRKLLRRLPKPILKSAYDLAVENTTQFEKATGELKKPFGTISKLVDRQLALARKLHRTVGEVTLAMPARSSDESKALKEIRATAGSLYQTDSALKEKVEQLYRDSKAASIDFDARRYNAESRYTLQEARRYELLVYKSNFESDRHMDRKTFLFYAMLTAQAGVTIATLALAFRKKSVVWGFAAMAGAAAVGFGGFVAMTM